MSPIQRFRCWWYHWTEDKLPFQIRSRASYWFCPVCRHTDSPATREARRAVRTARAALKDTPR